MTWDKPEADKWFEDLVDTVDSCGYEGAPLHLKLKAYHADVASGVLEKSCLQRKHVTELLMPRDWYLKSIDPEGKRPLAEVKKKIEKRGSGWSRERCRASGCVTATARCRRLVLREGGGGRDAKRNVSGASGSGRERGARAQGEHATATALKGLSLAQVRRINWRHKLYAGCAHLRDRRRIKTGRKCVNRSSLAQIKSDR